MMLVGRLKSVQELLCRAGAKISCLKSGVGYRRALAIPFDHGEKQVCVGITLRSVQYQVYITHRGGNTNGTHVRGAFISPQR